MDDLVTIVIPGDPTESEVRAARRAATDRGYFVEPMRIRPDGPRGERLLGFAAGQPITEACE